MPIYEYACGNCDHRFETIQRASDDPLEECPACGAMALKKLLSAPVFRLKGGGWYETDFKTGSKKNLSESGDGKPDGGKQDGDGAAKSGDKASGNGGDKAKSGEASKTAKSDKTATAAGA